MANWTIRRLDQAHDRTVFDCGQRMLNEWLKDRASQFDRRDLSRTFVATRPDEATVLGYYAVSTHRVIYDVLPSRRSTNTETRHSTGTASTPLVNLNLRR